MSEFEQITVDDGLWKVTDEELSSLSRALPRMLCLIPFIRDNPRLYHARLPCFLNASAHGGRFRLVIGHLLELWEQGYMRDEEFFFNGGTTVYDENRVFGFNFKTGKKFVMISSSGTVYSAIKHVFGLPAQRTIQQPEFSGERAEFSEFLKEIYRVPLSGDISLPEVKPHFIRKMEADNFKPAVPQMEYVPIPAGEFLMGYSENNSGLLNEPFPGVPVSVGKVEMLSSPVTLKMWTTVTNHCPKGISGDSSVVNWANWHESTAFARILSSADNKFDYRLPTEAEWEYASRAGTRSDFCFVSKTSQELNPFIQGMYFYDSTETTDVRLGLPNKWGLYDMGSLVHEWCSGRFNPVYSYPFIDYGLQGGGYRVAKGGIHRDGSVSPSSWCSNSTPWEHETWSSGVGFRLVRTPKKVIS